MSKEAKTITAQSIQRILKFLPIFEKQGYEFSKWCFPKPSKDGRQYFPCCEYSPDVTDFVRVLYEEGFVVRFDWAHWRYGEKFWKEPRLVKRARLESLRKLLTVHIRKERFCEGHLACVLQDGHIAGILQRLKAIRENMKE